MICCQAQYPTREGRLLCLHAAQPLAPLRPAPHVSIGCAPTAHLHKRHSLPLYPRTPHCGSFLCCTSSSCQHTCNHLHLSPTVAYAFSICSLARTPDESLCTAARHDKTANAVCTRPYSHPPPMHLCTVYCSDRSRKQTIARNATVVYPGTAFHPQHTIAVPASPPLPDLCMYSLPARCP